MVRAPGKALAHGTNGTPVYVLISSVFICG
jgi:hypothetical protein